MTTTLHPARIPLQSLYPDGSRANSVVTRFNNPNASSDSETVGAVGANSSSLPITGQQITKALLPRIGHTVKTVLSRQISVNIGTLIGLSLAIPALAYSILSVQVGQKQLDLALWTFCKSYPDDPQVQESALCQMYSQKKSVDELRMSDDTTLPWTPTWILDPVPGWLNIPSSIDRESCQVVCWKSFSPPPVEKNYALEGAATAFYLIALTIAAGVPTHFICHYLSTKLQKKSIGDNTMLFVLITVLNTCLIVHLYFIWDYTLSRGVLALRILPIASFIHLLVLFFFADAISPNIVSVVALLIPVMPVVTIIAIYRAAQDKDNASG